MLINYFVYFAARLLAISGYFIYFRVTAIMLCTGDVLSILLSGSNVKKTFLLVNWFMSQLLKELKRKAEDTKKWCAGYNCVHIIATTFAIC
jgi:hypothetical protein